MRRIKIPYLKIIIVLTTLFTSCNDDNPTPEIQNKPPMIELITQIDATEIIIGSTISIIANITDDDGFITEVKLIINSIEIGSLNASPYYFTWNTDSETEGTHLLKIVAFDDKGSSTTLEKQVNLSSIFTCGNDFFDTRDGSIYKTVQIGNQCWMSQNLNFKTDEGSWNYLNKESNGEVYGKLYSRETALIASPEGWHLPSDEDWKTLEGTVDSQFAVGDLGWDDFGYRGFDAGKNLKSSTGWIENGNGTDLYGFNALPGGLRTGAFTIEENNFENIGFSAAFWTSTSTSEEDYYLWNRELFSPKNTILRSFEDDWALSIRCIKN